jgi:flagellar biosynthetic protein FlhB
VAEAHDVERNYPATPRRLEQAREKGQVARSRELSAATSILATALAFSWLGPEFYRHCAALLHGGLVLDREAAFSSTRMLERLAVSSGGTLTALLPLLGAVLVATIAAPLALSGGVFSFAALRVDLARLNPVRGLTNMVSSHGWVELVKAIAKCVLLGGIGALVVMHDWAEMQAMSAQSARNAIPGFGVLMLDALFALAGGLALIAAIDVPYQLWRHRSGLKMSREEIRQEQRETDGDPQQKARIRGVQRAMARRRMMSAVPTADVIVANPTHYAVALEYREGRMRAPRVVAKGVDAVALRIREIGAAHSIPLLEAPPLARALYRHAELGAEIPPVLFAAVAQVLAYVHQVQRFRAAGGLPPTAPNGIDVPAELDPLYRSVAP